MIVKAKGQKPGQIKEPKQISNILTEILKAESKIDRDKEHFWVVGLTCRNTISYIELASLGILNSTIVHPREIFRLAIMKGVNSIIVAHNHPSGNLDFSKEDLEITDILQKSGDILGIKVLDHVVIDGVGGFKSIIG